jgi:hypothetical protein
VRLLSLQTIVAHALSPSMRRRAAIALWGCAIVACERSGAHPDRSFNTAVAQPAYAESGPTVLFDEAHRNIHKATGTYAPFAELIENDGYRLRRTSSSLSPKRLEGVDIVVIANALGRNERNDDHALSDAECDALVAWIHEGGSLLLITDHYPTGSAVGNLAHRLGVPMSGGVTEDSVSYDHRFDPSHIVFDSLPVHPITRDVQRVLSFTGQSLGVPDGAIALLPLRATALDRAPSPRVERSGNDVRVHVKYGPASPAQGRAQAIAMTLGNGRVVVLGEAAMASAQLSAYDGSPFGMNVSGYDNRQFVLNVMHWLSRHEEARPGP